MAIKIRNVENLTLGKPDTGAANSNVAIGIEAVDTTEFELAISRPTQEQKFQFAINNEGTADGTNYGGIAFTQGASAETIMASIKVDYTDTDNYPNLVFGTRSTSDALTILDDGSVSTNGRLDVNHDTVKLYNSANTNNTYFFAENTGAGNAGIKLKYSQGEFTIIANDRLRFISDDSPSVEVMSLHPDGNVGIGTGTATPGAKLVVTGNSDGGDSDCRIDIIDNDSTAGSSVPAISFRSGASTQIYQIRANDSLGLQFRNSSDITKITFDDDGKVGIGTSSWSTSSTGKLFVGGEVMPSAAIAQFDGFIRLKQGIYISDASTPANYVGWETIGNSLVTQVGGSGTHKVGIGTGSNAPLDRLNVWGDQISVSQNIVSSSTYDWLALRSNRTIDDYGGLNAEYAKLYFKSITGSHYSGSLHFSIKQESNSSTAMTDVMSLWHNGKVGIGTGSDMPSAKLELYDSTVNSLDLLHLKTEADSVGDYVGIKFAGGTDGNNATLALSAIRSYGGPSAGDSYIALLTSTNGSTLTQGLVQNHQGNVGIGTGNNALTEKLEVNGTVKATLFKGQFQGGSAGGGGRAIFNAQDSIENGNLQIFTNGNTENGGDAVTFVTDNNTSSPYGKVARVDSLYEKQAVDFIPVQPGVALEGEIWYSIPSNDNGAQGSIFFGISRYDKDKKLISGNIGLTYFASQTQVKDSNWHKVSGNITLPTSHTPYNGSDGGPVRYIKPYVIVNYSGGTQAVSFGGMYIARRKAITIGATQTLGSETPGQLIGETSNFTRSSDLITFNGKISQHLHEHQTGTGECNCWTLKDIDPLITYDSNNNPTSGFNIAPEPSNHDVTIIGSENQTPVLKINKEGLIVGFGVRDTVGTGSAGGVTSANLVTSGELYTNATFDSQEQNNITPVDGRITLSLFLKDSAFASAGHNHNASYGGSLVVGSGDNENKIGLLAADGTTSLGSYITVPYATTAGSANGGAAETLSTIKKGNDANYHLTFVDSNNDSATQESFFTDGALHYNPNKNKLTVDKIKCDTNLATAANTTTTALKHIIGKVDGGTVHYDFTDGQVKTFLGLGSMAYEATGNYYTKTAANTAFAAASHNHDSRYYTETEIDTEISTLNTSIGGKQATITGGATTITGSNLTASRALVSNSSGKVAVSAVTSTELGYLDGVTSAVQTQLNSLSSSISTNATNISSNDTDISNLSANKQDALTTTSNLSVNRIQCNNSFDHNSWNPSNFQRSTVGVQSQAVVPHGTLSRPVDGNQEQLPAGMKTVEGSYIGLPWNSHDEVSVAWHWGIFQNVQTILPITGISDRRVKTNIEPIYLGLDFINRLNPVSFHLKQSETPRRQFGVIADELLTALEECGGTIETDSMVHITDRKVVKEGALMSVSYTELIAPLIKSVQELSAKVESLQSRIEELEK